MFNDYDNGKVSINQGSPVPTITPDDSTVYAVQADADTGPPCFLLLCARYTAIIDCQSCLYNSLEFNIRTALRLYNKSDT